MTILAGGFIMRRQCSISAFTLIELLLVLAIIALIVGLFLSAVQQTRAAAARAQCLNNLHQLGLALYSYHDAQGVFSPGIRRSPDPYPFLSWEARLLPYLEQQPLWNQIQQAFAQTPYFARVPPHVGLSTVQRLFLCPADGRSDSSNPQPDMNITVAFTDYMGVSGTNTPTKDGILYPNSTVRFADISDGTSNTIIVGERPPSPTDAGYMSFGWWYAGEGQSKDGSAEFLLGVRETNRSSLLASCPPGPYHFQPGRADDPCDLLHYWSRHNGGGQFLFADGSVRFLSYSSDSVLPALATRAGGEIISLPE
jgi:prepilin-type processing-associated H-X9-DG protein/prepilin-type N-terminal cleavage/methylation domain-containing protein